MHKKENVSTSIEGDLARKNNNNRVHVFSRMPRITKSFDKIQTDLSIIGFNRKNEKKNIYLTINLSLQRTLSIFNVSWLNRYLLHI